MIKIKRDGRTDQWTNRQSDLQSRLHATKNESGMSTQELSERDRMSTGISKIK